ncbi:YjbF family lipoprotein [Roseivivax jejudonensis]|nr:YjbF family lipoprotein [Roseivivax jejudonensis]
MRWRALLLLTGLAACASGAAVDPRSVLTRETLDASPTPILLAELPELETAATLAPVAARDGVVHWQTADGVRISLRDGVAVATRGTGFDLMSADVEGSRRAALGAGAAGYYPRFHTYLDGEDQIAFVTLQCRVTGRTAETLDLIGLGVATIRTDERCHLPDRSFDNAYWRRADGTVVKARQWIGDGAGYLLTERLTR